MKVVTYFIYCLSLGLCEISTIIKGVYCVSDDMCTMDRAVLTLFEEKSDLVPTFKEIIISNVLSGLTGREFGHRVVLQREVVEERVRFREERRDGFRAKGIWDDEVAIPFKCCDLLFREAFIV